MRFAKTLTLVLFGTGALAMGCGGSSSDVAQFTTNTQPANPNPANPNPNPNPASTINFTFTGTSNAITQAFPAGTVVTGTLTPNAAGATGLLSQLTQALSTPPTIGSRAININISASNPLAVGNVFNVVANNQPTPRATINYTEQTTAGVFAFSSQAGGGTLRIDSLTPGAGVSGTIGVTLQGVNLNPVAQAGNSATGVLTINGPATLTF